MVLPQPILAAIGPLAIATVRPLTQNLEEARLAGWPQSVEGARDSLSLLPTVPIPWIIPHPMRRRASRTLQQTAGTVPTALPLGCCNFRLLQMALDSGVSSSPNICRAASNFKTLCLPWRRLRLAIDEHKPLELVSDEIGEFELKAMLTLSHCFRNCRTALRRRPLLRRKPGPTKNLDPPRWHIQRGPSPAYHHRAAYQGCKRAFLPREQEEV